MADRFKMVTKIGGGDFGWTEEWYWVTELDFAASLAAVLLDTAAYNLLRRAWLGSNWNIQAVRLERVDVNGNSFLVGQTRTYYSGINCGPGLLAGPCQNPWIALLMDCYTPDLFYHRQFLARGIPDAQLCVGIPYAVPYPIPGPLAIPLTPWRGWMANDAGVLPAKQGVWSLRAINKARGRVVKSPVTNVAFSGNNWQITTALPLKAWDGDVGPRAVQAADVVHVHNANSPTLSGLNGNHPVISASTNIDGSATYVLDARQCVSCDPVYNHKAIAWGVNYSLFPIGAVDPSRVVKRDTGGPFFGTRGRRRKRVC